MALILETTESRAGEEGVETQSRELRFLVQLDTGETYLDGLTVVYTYAPETFDGYLLQGISWSPKADAANVVDYTAKYSNKEPRKPEQETNDDPDGTAGEFSFDTTGGQEKIYYSKETIARYGVGVTAAVAPDFRGGINVTKSGVGGVDIVVPNFKFHLTKKVRLGGIPSGYLNTLYQMTGRTNDRTFSMTYQGITLTFQRRELLFLGGGGSQKGSESWTFRYSFHGSVTGTNLSVGNGTIGEPFLLGDYRIPEKKGWDYLWVEFTEQTDSVSHTLVDVPNSAHVERVTDEADFRLLRV